MCNKIKKVKVDSKKSEILIQTGDKNYAVKCKTHNCGFSKGSHRKPKVSDMKGAVLKEIQTNDSIREPRRACDVILSAVEVITDKGNFRFLYEVFGNVGNTLKVVTS